MSPAHGSRSRTLRDLVTRSATEPEADGFSPVAVEVVDLEDPAWPRLADRDDYGSALVLGRLHGRPLDEVRVARPRDGAATLLDAVRRTLQERWGPLVEEHLASHRGPGASGGAHPVAGWDCCLASERTRWPSVSVVVPTYRRPATLVRCVDSILACGYPDLEVLVADNAPDDPRTAEVLASRYGPQSRVRYLAEPTPGASRARNRGVSAAGGEIIAFVDDDIRVDRLWVQALAGALEDEPEVDCVTGLVIPEALTSQVQVWFEQFGGFNRGYRRRLFDMTTNRGDTLLYPYTAGALGGLGNAAFRRSALDVAEAFDVTLGPGTPAFGAEDQDAFVKLLRRGGRLLYEPSAMVRHSHRDSYADLRWQIFTYGAGMVAGLVHWGITDRSVARELAVRTLEGLPRILRGGNRYQALQSATEECPPELRRLERLGHLYGPVAYARATSYRRRIDREERGPAR